MIGAMTAFGQSNREVPAVSVSASTPVMPDLAEVLRAGQQMEMERRWSEALSHYEEAIRRFPDDRTLESHFASARLHYDLGRRYADQSFREKIRALSFREALDVYSEVLLKIQAHYVEAPKWKGLVEHGLLAMDVALSEKAFLADLPASVDAARAAAYRQEVRSTLGPRPIGTRNDARDAVAWAAQLAQSRLGISPSAVVLEYMCGATNALDVYSAYLTPDQLSEVYSQIEGNFVGLGIELKAEAGTLLIVRVIPGSPAQKGGILDGDHILSVDGHATDNITTEAAADLLQGLEGSVAELNVVTPGQSPRLLRIRRERVEVPSVERASIVPNTGGVAYLKLTCFQKTTSKDMDDALWALHRQGMRSLIVDVRGNPGGLLVSAVDVVDKFVGSGVVVSTHGRSAQEDFVYQAQAPNTWRVPLVVLIDGDSASAAEIFAGAIRDHQRGTIVGERSYGKGSVQGIFPLNSTSAGVRLTTAKFYSPTGKPYNRVGVEPNVVAQRAARPVDGIVLTAQTDDTMFSSAVDIAKKMIRNP